MSVDELLYPPAQSKEATPPVDAVRAFVFTSGQKWLADRGILERYRASLPASLQGMIGQIMASDWLSLDEALDLYDACDKLGLATEDQIDLGRVVSRANNGIFLRTIANLAGKLGLSPWTALRSIDRVWQRNNRGGAVAVYKLGERVARLEFWQVPLARSPFFVTSMRGALDAGIEGFCRRAIITDVPELWSPDGFAVRLAW
jgi:hypothetical protein